MATELEREVARYCAWLEDRTGLSLHREGDQVTGAELAVEVHPEDDRAASSPRWRWWLLEAAVVIGVLAFGLSALVMQDSDRVGTDTVPATPAPSSLDVTTTLGRPAVDDLGATATSTVAIGPLTTPEDAVDLVTVAQRGIGRVWVATYSAEEGFGLAFSDDGGATWTRASLPDGVRATLDGPDLALAADGDHVAVAVWGYDETDTVGDIVYVSDDAGRTWTTSAFPAEHDGGVNSAKLDVLPDGRLTLVWYLDAFGQGMLVSTGSDWSRLQRVDDLSGTRSAPSSSATTAPGPP